MDVRLRVLAGVHAGKEIPLRAPKFLIGRAEDCHLRAGSELISRHHCAILIGESKIIVQDLASRNGTKVNGEVIVSDEREVRGGDQLIIGPLHFEVVLQHRVGGEKRPAVKDLSDAAARTAELSKTSSVEDEISSWLGEPVHHVAAKPAADTQPVKLSITDTVETPKPSGNGKASKSSSAAGKSSPGKLPKMDVPMAKDSREAAAAILRKMSKRR